jgi:hypothetical protein
LLNCCSQHSLFIVEILIIERIRISLYDVSDIHILLCSELVNGVKFFHEIIGISMLSSRLSFALKVYEIFFVEQNDYRYVHAFNCCVPGCWSAGNGF